MHCAFTEGDGHAWLWRVADRFAAPARQKGLQLHLPPHEAQPIPVHWDFSRIEQLLTNLLANSLHYTSAPGTVAVAWQCDGRLFTLTVDDTPPGVNPADLEDLFEPLFRADRARQRSADHGSGLGLSIARSIAQAHQGTLTASPSGLGGLQLCVQLPVRPSTNTREAQA
jgi:two-component system sensor histidine kinase BaeS